MSGEQFLRKQGWKNRGENWMHQRLSCEHSFVAALLQQAQWSAELVDTLMAELKGSRP